LDVEVDFSIATYSVFYSNPQTRHSSSMHRQLPDNFELAANSTRFDEITVPFFAVDKFEWIKDPNTTLSPRQLAADVS
jgi:hypothetical protein